MSTKLQAHGVSLPRAGEEDRACCQGENEIGSTEKSHTRQTISLVVSVHEGLNATRCPTSQSNFLPDLGFAAAFLQTDCCLADCTCQQDQSALETVEVRRIHLRIEHAAEVHP